MLVRGGMEDEAGSVNGEEIFHQSAVAGIAEDKRRGHACARGGVSVICQRALELVEVVFGGFEEKQCRQSAVGHTQGERGANGASRAGHEDRRVGKAVDNFRRWRFKRGPRKKFAPENIFQGWRHRRSINLARHEAA